MRLVHTSDWHLGRLFHGVHLTPDQAFVLDQLLDFVRDSRPEAVLVAGDVFDRAVPPPEAVELLDDVLSRLVLGLKVQVILIAGNHDSPIRLSFGHRIMAQTGLHVRGELSADPAPVMLADSSGTVAVYALPYAEPAMVRDRLSAPDALDHHAAMAARIRSCAPPPPPRSRSIIVAHAFVSGGSPCESERPLTLGGTGLVEGSVFEGFDYAALGHLHRPQDVGQPKIHYPGSLLKYSFSEIKDTKSVSLIEMDHRGRVSLERAALTPRRDLRRIEGLMKDLLDGPAQGQNREDYLLVSLLDKGALLDPMGRLREVYPNILHLERPFLNVEGRVSGPGMDHLRRSETELFADFFEQVTSEALNGEEADKFAQILEGWRRMERDA
ncbi:MAG: exonuclease SbcCD subunit D [Pseudomonadota bacterium]